MTDKLKIEDNRKLLESILEVVKLDVLNKQDEMLIYGILNRAIDRELNECLINE